LINKLFKTILLVGFAGMLVGCATEYGVSSKLRAKNFSYPEEEAQWIRDGQPIEFEGQKWFPSDNMENFMDSEVYLMGVYNGAEFFVEKLDVKPYNQVYTKFGRNKFRVFILKPSR
jgi:hypothetical protein